MGLTAKSGFVGIVTAIGETRANAGACRVADNVCLRKEEALVQRPSFASTALTRVYKAAYPYRGQLWYIGAANAVYTPAQNLAQYAYANTAWLATMAYVTPGALRDDIQSAKEARGNLYFASSLGVFKVTTAATTELLRSGIVPTETGIGQIQTPTLGSDLLTANQQVAYRIVTVLTDPNGVIIRSRPSGAVLVSSGASAVTPSFTLYYSGYAANVATKRTIEVYRTRIFPSSATVDDEMQLIASYSPPVGNSTSWQFYDRVPDTKRTTTLYTSPSRGGIESANDRPPGCACIERFRGSLFFGNTTGPHRIIFSYNTSGVVTGSLTGVGVRAATGTNAANSTTITSVSNVTGVQPGAIVTTLTSGTVGMVTSVVGSTVTVSQPIPVAQTASSVYFADAITLDGAPFQLGQGPNLSNGGLYTTTSGAMSNTSQDVFTAYEISPPEAGYSQTVVVERVTTGGTAFQMRASHGDEMSPAVPLGNAATGLLSTNDVLPNGLAWSEPDEPEHCPPKNFARVGDTGKAILGLVATRDRLLIFKEDGLFMLTGDTVANFGIYPLDTTCLCILPGSIRRMKNTVYLLTNNGLVAVDENGGVTVISRPIQNEIAPIITQIRAAAKSNGGLFYMPGLLGITGASDDANGEYWLMLGTTTPSFGGQVLVFNDIGGFTTYTFAGVTPYALASDSEGQPLVITSTPTLLTPTTATTTMVARVQPHGFTDQALLQKFWTHIVAAFSRLTGTTSVQVKFTSSESYVDGASITEAFDITLDPTTSLVQLPGGSLLRHPVPNAHRRGWTLRVEIIVNVSNGGFTLELIGAESRPGIANKEHFHGTGAT